MNNPTSKMREKPFPLCFDRQDLTIEFPYPTDTPFRYCVAPVPKFVQAGRQKIKVIPIRDAQSSPLSIVGLMAHDAVEVWNILIGDF
jgi:hypothetical protein